ncbi:MAG TPA: DEAD/DEAH box helicase [Rhabdochlamydiaceae bacterium]|jgi:SNF2 family DNA or RNA helicase
MTALSYSLDAQCCGKATYLIISLEKSSPLSTAALMKCAQKESEREALDMLIKEEKRFSQGKADAFSLFHVSAERSFTALKALGSTGRVLWRGQKVVVDPFVALEIYIEAEKKGQSLSLTGKWRQGERCGPLTDCEWVFAAEAGWAIKNRIIHPLASRCDHAWLDLIYPKSSLLEGPSLTEFMQAVREEEFPSLVWIGKEEIVVKKALEEPIPFLVLNDRHGAFADLWLDYGTYGKIAAHDPKKATWRNFESEKGWEKDLLETDFIKKVVDASHYYCPLDKVSKSLTFLLDIGWKIFDFRNRQLLRQKGEEIAAQALGEHILIRGKVHYDAHSVDLKDLVGAFTRKDRFIDLSPTTVGLIDCESKNKWEDLTEYEVVSDAIAFKRQSVGQLCSLFAPQKEQADNYGELFRSLPLGWQAALGAVSEKFQGELFAYQQEGLKWLEFVHAGRCGGLLADEMGLGKTVQVVAFFSQLQLTGPSLIVVPTSLLFNWKREFERFLPSCPIHVHAGSGRLECAELDKPHIILTSYAILRQEALALKELDFCVVVLDEAQTIKNPDSQIAQIAFSLRAQMRLAITGTPIENRLQDLWSLFHFLLPGLIGERSAFHAAISASSSDGRYLQQVKRKIRPFLLRRKKQDVLSQLPPKIEQVIWVDMTQGQRERYEHWLCHAKAGVIKKVALDGASAHRMEILEAILRLRQLCAHPWLMEKGGEGDLFALSGKCERLFCDLQEVIEEGKKVIIYSQFTTMLHLIRREVANKGWSFVYLDGGTKDRESIVKQFQEDADISIFLISLKAGGVGLNLTAADYVFLLDPWWNAAVEQQAIDRAHRVGRTQAVIARRYITALSIEEKMMHLKEHKLNLSKGLFEENDAMEALSLDDLVQLIIE